MLSVCLCKITLYILIAVCYNIITVKIRNTKTKEIYKMNVQEIAKELRGQDVWSMELLELLCDEADLTEEFENADSETFESVVYKAADILNVEI